MKTKIFYLLLVSLLMGCSTEVKKENEELKKQTEKLKAENQAFRNQNKKLKASIEGYEMTLKEIDDNLKLIDVSATMVGKMSIEERKNATNKDRIMARIASIKSLLDNSKLKVLALDQSLNSLRKKYGNQSEVVLSLNREMKAQTQLILEKETEYLTMKSSLEEDIEGLQDSFDEQFAMSQQLNEILNRAFYIAGSNKVLKEKGIVNREGGFIGIGRVKVLNANSSDSAFKQLKKDETNTLTIASKKVKLVTEHPTASFQIVAAGEQTQLIILDQSFWKNGNYLVVETN